MDTSKMTNEEMAQVLDNHAANARMQEKCYRVASSDLDDLAQAEQWRRLAEATEAGAAALRAVDSIRQWNNKVRTASYRDLAVERIWHEAAAKVIDLLPAPPESV